MFKSFARVWTPATLARNLRNKPISLLLAGERLVLFRDAAGRAQALLDRCPHRGVRLSLGKVTPEGQLQCPFHAWTFDGQGGNTHVPLNPEAKRERLCATAFPVREIGGLLWVYTAPGAQAPQEPEVPETLTRPDLAYTFLEIEWAAHWTRAMENMLDSPHVPYVHRTTIGRSMAGRITRDSRMVITWEDMPYGGRTRALLDGNDEGGAYLDFCKPNMMVLNIPIPGKVFKMHAICVPVDDHHVRMIVVGARSFARAGVLNPFFNRSNRIIVEQDKAVVESSFPMEVPPAAQEVSVATDRATLNFRKYYYDVLREPDPPTARMLPILGQAA